MKQTHDEKLAKAAKYAYKAMYNRQMADLYYAFGKDPERAARYADLAQRYQDKADRMYLSVHYS